MPGTFALRGRKEIEIECVDTFSDLKSCGGCASTGAGRDCGAITGAWNVGCEYGECKVYTCTDGYEKSDDGESCVLIAARL